MAARIAVFNERIVVEIVSGRVVGVAASQIKRTATIASTCSCGMAVFNLPAIHVQVAPSTIKINGTTIARGRAVGDVDVVEIKSSIVGRSSIGINGAASASSSAVADGTAVERDITTSIGS